MLYMKHTETFMNTIQKYIDVLALLLLFATVFLGYRYLALRTTLENVQQEAQHKEDQFINQLAVRNLDIATLESENEELREALDREQDKLRDLGEEVEDLTDTLGDLEKLNELDKELLQKYSKVSFLNEHYVPSRLVDIDEDYLYDESQEMQIHREVEPFLEDMIEDADDDDIKLFIRSAYRSFGTQAILKQGYTVSYGSGANAFSADQGYSEHQLGTTVDFTTTGLNGGLNGFGNTPAYEWLLDNAHKYGFTLSYPEGNAYYIFEPWHWRFVGRDLARDLHRREKHFYDLDQRDINEYLLEIFD